jgi:hypothetical protein
MKKPAIRLRRETAAALNVLIWKMGMPSSCKTADQTAAFIISELIDKGMIGLRWDAEKQEFIQETKT